MKSQRMLSGVAALGGLVLLLGCGTQTSAGDPGQAPAKSSPTSPDSPKSPGLTAAPPKPTVTVPPGTGKPVKPGDFAPEVIWQRDQLIVTAFGSSTCRPTADEAVVADSHTIVVRFGERSKDQLCTDDYGPTRSRIPAPAGDIDLDSDVFATFELEGTPSQLIPVELVNPVRN
ncbi:MAG: hypothetical protein ACR2GB_01570 [Nocardioidaceae bacterium]